MDVDIATVAGAVVAGLAAGVLSGMFGVGGAVITTPAIRALGVSPIMAVGSTIPAILPAAVTGAHRYHREGLVDWRVAWSCGLAGAALAVTGAWISDLVDARWLMVVTAGLLAWSGISAIAKSRAERRAAGGADVGAPAATRPDVPELALADGEADPLVAVSVGDDEAVGPVDAPVWKLAGVGGLAGFVAGLLGVGGGIVMMPMFTNVLKLPVKVAVASSLVAVALFSVPALVTHAALDHIDWGVALALVVGTVPGARLGARIAIGTADATLRLWLGAFFCVIAVVYGASELAAILG